jgi:hypothetical protein
VGHDSAEKQDRDEPRFIALAGRVKPSCASSIRMNRVLVLRKDEPLTVVAGLMLDMDSQWHLPPKALASWPVTNP